LKQENKTMKTILLIALQFFAFVAMAQVEIGGKVITTTGEPVSGANVFIQGSYDGTTSDSLGFFRFKTDLTGTQTLIASFIGFETTGINLDIKAPIFNISITLKELLSELDEVVINAGTFEASDKKKSVMLKPLDIALTAGAMGDIYGAFGTLSGSQKVGEDGRLFVRGGEGYETKTFMDGMLVNSPYYSKMPDLPTRGRFSPILFNGSVFSTGGYSAEYGQALSSVVSLNTVALEPESKLSISLMSVGVQGSTAKRWDNTSLAINGEYLYTGFSNKIFKQNIDWLEMPVIYGTTLMFRHKTSETGMIKSFGSFSRNISRMLYNNFGELTFQEVGLSNLNSYLNTTYNEMLSKKWMVNTGIALNFDNEKTELKPDLITTVRKSGQIKACFTRFISEKTELKTGADFIINDYRQSIDLNGHFELPFRNNQVSVFSESEFKINSLIAIRAGIRGEYSSLLREFRLMPRLSSAIKSGKFSQVSFAFGTFYQNPEDDYLKFDPTLSPEKASHTILTYQFKKETQTLRIEAYHKNYSKLVKYTEPYMPVPGNYTNTGSGYSNGFDIFWRNEKAFGKSDYWVTYSWNDSKRNYKDFPTKATPYYVSEHNLSVAYKKFFFKTNTFGAFTYTFASGRPYYNPNNPEFMSDLTKPFNDISFSLTHIFYLFGKQTVAHLVANNLFGFNNVFGYSFSETPNQQGLYESKPVTSPQKRMAVILISIQL
jgi:hypothetical protein